MLNLQNIRSEIYDLVTGAAAFNASNTDQGRYEGDSIAASDLPKAVIQFESSEFEYESIGPTRSIRITLNWAIHVFTATEASMDGLVQQILNQFTDRTLGGYVQDTTIIGTEYQFSSEADNDYGRGTISFQTTHNSQITD